MNYCFDSFVSNSLPREAWVKRQVQRTLQINRTMNYERNERIKRGSPSLLTVIKLLFVEWQENDTRILCYSLPSSSYFSSISWWSFVFSFSGVICYTHPTSRSFARSMFNCVLTRAFVTRPKFCWYRMRERETKQIEMWVSRRKGDAFCFTSEKEWVLNWE